MKVAELVSALEELGSIYRHSSKNEPKPCIREVLELLKGKEQHTLAELKAAVSEKGGTAGKGKGTKPPKVFNHEEHLNRLLSAKSEASFTAAIEALKKAKPTNENLARLLAGYAGVAPKKKMKKDEFFDALLRVFRAEQRHDARAQFSESGMPM
jgi:hypothetical protein